jgi:hypothetical protein
MKTMSYMKGNAYGTAVFGLALMFGAIWLLAGCAPQETEVLGKRAERTTTTTEAWTEAPPGVDEQQVPDRDGVLAVLMDRVPSLDGIPQWDIRTKLLGTVCDEIDNSDGDFAHVGDVIVDSSEGNFYFDYSDAGYIVAAAVLLECPEWQDAAREFANS